MPAYVSIETDRQQRHIFPFKYPPRMGLASALERLEKPQDSFPEGILLLALLPTTPNDRHPSFGWPARNWRVPFNTYSSLASDSFCCLFCASMVLLLALGCRGVLPGQLSLLWMPGRCWRPPRIPIYTHRHRHTHPLRFLRHQTAGVKYAIWSSISNWAICNIVMK